MLSKLYSMARDIPKELEFRNKYTWLGVNEVLPVKYLDINDVITQPDLTIKNYINRHGAVLLFPNIINNTIVDIFVRPIDGGEILKLGDHIFPYNIGNFSPTFRYGDPVILVEGIADLAALKLMSKDFNVIAMQSSKLSNQQIEFLSLITNNIVVIPDRDDAGATGFTRMWYQFKKHRVNLVSIEQFRYFKDTGDFLDKIIYYEKTEDNGTIDEIQLVWNYYQTAIETEIRNMR